MFLDHYKVYAVVQPCLSVKFNESNSVTDSDSLQRKPIVR